MKFIDLTGKRFEKLTVLNFVETKNGHTYWLCKCDCGNLHIATSCNLKRKNVLSCGCVKREGNNVKHRRSNTLIYNCWLNMKTRCYNVKSKDYKNYGGRGITVCDEWRNSFNKFYEYVSKLPHFEEQGYSIDRINVNGNYEPGNVRWATAKEQANNRRKAGVTN